MTSLQRAICGKLFCVLLDEFALCDGRAALGIRNVDRHAEDVGHHPRLQPADHRRLAGRIKDLKNERAARCATSIAAAAAAATNMPIVEEEAVECFALRILRHGKMRGHRLLCARDRRLQDERAAVGGLRSAAAEIRVVEITLDCEAAIVEVGLRCVALRRFGEIENVNGVFIAIVDDVECSRERRGIVAREPRDLKAEFVEERRAILQHSRCQLARNRPLSLWSCSRPPACRVAPAP